MPPLATRLLGRGVFPARPPLQIDSPRMILLVAGLTLLPQPFKFAGSVLLTNPTIATANSGF